MDNEIIQDHCPHCGARLSPWQKVLLKVDRAIMCKSCWYRIILEPEKQDETTSEKKSVEKKRGSNGNL